MGETELEGEEDGDVDGDADGDLDLRGERSPTVAQEVGFTGSTSVEGNERITNGLCTGTTGDDCDREGNPD